MAEWVLVEFVHGPRHRDVAWIFFSDGRPNEFIERDAVYRKKVRWLGGTTLYRYQPER